MEDKLFHILLAPLTPAFGLLLILTGLYSLYYNAADAKRKNHRRAEKACIIGGWLYIAGGAVVIFLSARSLY